MRTLVNDIKNIGLRGAISNAVVTNYYNVKSQYDVTSREIKSKMRRFTDDFDDEDDESFDELDE